MWMVALDEWIARRKIVRNLFSFLFKRIRMVCVIDKRLILFNIFKIIQVAGIRVFNSIELQLNYENTNSNLVRLISTRRTESSAFSLI